jgi:hypothetical protein
MGAGSICSTTHSFFCFSGESQMSARGISLHIGVNRCNPDHYRGWEGPLKSCENDVETMQVIAKSRGFEASTLKTEQATRDAVKAAITGAARELSAGDFFLVSYSGHGGRVRDVTGEESDQKDDTWCLYDGQLLDDELNVMFAAFAAGVRILVVSDSCHSGTLLKGESDPQNQAEIDDDFIIPRAMPRKAASDTYKSNRSFYTQIQDDLPVPRPEIKASVRLLSGCQEHELSYGSDECGRFTWAVNNLFKDGAFSDNYKAFHREIVAMLARPAKSQTPGHMVVGREDPDFDRQPPFTI